MMNNELIGVGIKLSVAGNVLNEKDREITRLQFCANFEPLVKARLIRVIAEREELLKNYNELKSAYELLVQKYRKEPEIEATPETVAAAWKRYQNANEIMQYADRITSEERESVNKLLGIAQTLEAKLKAQA